MPALQLHIVWKGKNIHTFVQDWIYGFGAAIVPSAMHLYVHSTNMIIR